jgi:hypothetical protein
VHDGLPLDIARALRTTCRPTSAAWTTPPLDFDTAARHIHNWARHRPQPDADAVTWVRGHDGSPGPGYAFAELVARVLAATARRSTPAADPGAISTSLDPPGDARRGGGRPPHAVHHPTADRRRQHRHQRHDLRAAIDRLHGGRVIVTAAATASISRYFTRTAPSTRRGDLT